MINSAKLKGKIVENGYSQESLADALGMSKASFNLKINNKTKTSLSIAQVETMRKLLKINDPEEADRIFFANLVSERKQNSATI